MVLANQNAKLTGPDQGFLVSPLVLTQKPWERGWVRELGIGVGIGLSYKNSTLTTVTIYTAGHLVKINFIRKIFFGTKGRITSRFLII